MRSTSPCFLFIIVFLMTNNLFANPWNIEAGMHLSRFEQQVKTEVGGEMSTPLIEDMAFGVTVFGSYRWKHFFSLGVFLQHERGERKSTQYLGLNNDSIQLSNTTGGSFYETWLGPFVRFNYRNIFLDIGYGAFGVRKDRARTDIPTRDGSTSDNFNVSSFAWLFSMGSQHILNEHMTLVLRIQYRVRYYDSRGSTPLADNIVHGTQDITPYIGLLF